MVGDTSNAEPELVAQSIPALLNRAKKVLSQQTWDYIEGASSGETTAQRNRQVFGQWAFRPRLLAPAASAASLTQQLGPSQIDFPVVCAPFGFDGFIHPDGHAGVARAAAAAGTLSIVPEASHQSMEVISEAAGGRPGFLQVGLNRHESQLSALINRAADAGYRGVVFTHMPALAWRERLRENGSNLEQYGMGNMPTSASAPLTDQTAQLWDWGRFSDYVQHCPLPWMLKGVQRPEDARRAIEAGAAAVYVSNFGGRNLDGLAPALHVLPSIAQETDGAVPIVFDSGVRRGTDVAKALALGADVVAVGRLTAFALGAGGEAGVRTLLALIRGEFAAVMSELGVARVGDLGTDVLEAVSGFTFPTLEFRNRETH
jgi:4-hydroxymandelate oxidase